MVCRNYAQSFILSYAAPLSERQQKRRALLMEMIQMMPLVKRYTRLYDIIFGSHAVLYVSICSVTRYVFNASINSKFQYKTFFQAHSLQGKGVGGSKKPTCVCMCVCVCKGQWKIHCFTKRSTFIIKVFTQLKVWLWACD